MRGKRSAASELVGSPSAHPRACGENPRPPTIPRRSPGSSPRIRGKRHNDHAGPRRRRFIPAHAGKTGGPATHWTGTWIHPRACGENDATPRQWGRLAGSSPRMRGKQWASRYAAWASGFIPAHAGKTRRGWPRTRGRRVHPPRMRGKPEHVCGGAPRGGFIPAHAGKTCPGSTPLSLRRVHPHACGENHGDWDVRPRGFGSSPRMRGKRDCGGCRPPGCGFIPAHAGKTSPHGASGRGTWVHPRACGENPPKPARPPWYVGSSPRMRENDLRRRTV